MVPAGAKPTAGEACKDAVNEMHAPDLKPDALTLQMARLPHAGVVALGEGYAKLGRLRLSWPARASGCD